MDTLNINNENILTLLIDDENEEKIFFDLITTK